MLNPGTRLSGSFALQKSTDPNLSPNIQPKHLEGEAPAEPFYEKRQISVIVGQRSKVRKEGLFAFRGDSPSNALDTQNSRTPEPQNSRTSFQSSLFNLKSSILEHFFSIPPGGRGSAEPSQKEGGGHAHPAIKQKTPQMRGLHEPLIRQKSISGLGRWNQQGDFTHFRAERLPTRFIPKLDIDIRHVEPGRYIFLCTG